MSAFPPVANRNAEPLAETDEKDPTGDVVPSSLDGKGVDVSSRTRSAQPSYSESQNPMQQVRIGEAVVPSSRRKFLALRDLGIGIRFEEIRNAIGREAEIDAGISVELQGSVDSFGHSLDTDV
jgi:hypothetical protein